MMPNMKKAILILRKHLRSQINNLLQPSFQAQIIDSELTAKLLGRGVAVSPVVTVEPRRRKFHKAITLSMPAPRPHTQGMTNQYSTSSAPTLRLLCSISGTIIIFCLYLKMQIVFVIGIFFGLYSTVSANECMTFVILLSFLNTLILKIDD